MIQARTDTQILQQLSIIYYILLKDGKNVPNYRRQRANHIYHSHYVSYNNKNSHETMFCSLYYLLPIFAIIHLLFNSRFILKMKSDNVIKSWFKCPNISSPLVVIQIFNFHMVHSLIFDILSCILDSSVMIYYQQMWPSCTGRSSANWWVVLL